MDELTVAVESCRARCAVVGLGYIGSAVADALLNAGFDVRGYDRSEAAAARFAERNAAAPGFLSAGTSDDAITDADIVHVAVPVPCAGHDRPKLEALRSVAQSVRDRPARPRLVLLHSTIPPGTTRWFAEQCGGSERTLVAHCPERLQPGNSAWTIANTPHVVAGVNQRAGRLALRMLRRISADVQIAPAPEVTELAKLMENAFIAVGVALAGEFARVAHAFGVSGTHVAAAAASKPFSYYGFFPGPGVGGHCIPNDLAMLSQMRTGLGMDAPLLDATDISLAGLPALTVERIQSAMGSRGKRLPGASVLVVGLGYKVGSSDLTNTPAREIVRALRRLGAAPAYVDSGVAAFEVDGEPVERVRPAAMSAARFAVSVVLSGDPRVSPELLERASELIIDASGGRAMPRLPTTVVRL